MPAWPEEISTATGKRRGRAPARAGRRRAAGRRRRAPGPARRGPPPKPSPGTAPGARRDRAPRPAASRTCGSRGPRARSRSPRRGCLPRGGGEVLEPDADRLDRGAVSPRHGHGLGESASRSPEPGSAGRPRAPPRAGSRPLPPRSPARGDRSPRPDGIVFRCVRSRLRVRSEGVTLTIRKPCGASIWSCASCTIRSPSCAPTRSMAARMAPGWRLLIRPGEARTRTSTVFTASPVSSRSLGTFRSSTGTTSPRSAVCRPRCRTRARRREGGWRRAGRVSAQDVHGSSTVGAGDAAGGEACASRARRAAPA